MIRAQESEQQAQLAIQPDGSLAPAELPQESEQKARPTQETLFTSGPTIRGQLTMKEVQ